MGLKVNAEMIFQGYEILDGGINLHFLCLDPSDGQPTDAGVPTDYYVLITDTELSTISTAAQFKTLVITKLQRKLRATGIANKLDALVGQKVVI
jgi:hypothetical protein